MTDYKLEPKSIVDELAQFIRQVDGNNKMGAGALADKICERFHVNSPDVQGELVVWQYYQDGKWWNGDDRIKDHRKNTEEAGFTVRDVYAANQPLTEEKGLQPAKNPPLMPQVKPPKAEQQPDVSALVEALELARWTLAMAALEGEVTRRIDSALANYRKQWGEK